MADLGDQAQVRYIHLREISVDSIKRRPTSVLKLVFKDLATGVEHKSNKFKKGDHIHWNIDTYIMTHTCATFTIRRSPFNIKIAEISVEFKPNEFRDGRAVALEDSNCRVAVNFVCGRSRALADITCVLGSHARITPIVSKVFRSLKLPKLAALPPPTHKRGYDVLYAAVHWLDDDILLGVFNIYRLDDTHRWTERLGWRNLSQVCQRWRHLMYQFASHLGIYIECTKGAPRADHLPPLPLLIDYRFTASASISEKDESGIYHALQLRDHTRRIILHLPPSVFQKCLVLMDGHFPILEHLSLWSVEDKITTVALPKAFLAPNLRHLDIPGIGRPPKRLLLLTSTLSLTTLVLWNIQPSGYFRPRLLAARLSSLSQLRKLSIGFSVPIPTPSTKKELLGEQGAPVTLPSLTNMVLRGVSAYLESFLAQIRAPLLDRLEITLFNQITFALPHLTHFINITEKLKIPNAKVFFGRDEVFIVSLDRRLPGPFRLCVRCTQLDWQINCAAQICNALIPALSGVEQLVLDFYDKVLPTEWQNGEIDRTTWREVLRPFVGMKELHIEDGLSKELSRALEDVGSEPGFLPNLQQIFAEDNLFASFIDTRWSMSRPVQFSKPTLPAFPKLTRNKRPPLLEQKPPGKGW